MNKKGEMWIWMTIIISILFTVFTVASFAKLEQVSNDKLQKANCNTMEQTGHSTFLKKLDLFGFDMLDCYIVLDDGTAVPYDRYRGID